MKGHLVKSFLLFISILSEMQTTFSQECENRYLALTYKAATWETFAHTAYTPSNEIIVAGTLRDYNGVGHLAKFSKNGIPLWSNYYRIGFFSFYFKTFFSHVQFNDFVLTPDGGAILVGNVQRYYESPTEFFDTKMALMAKIDKYGNVEWSKTYGPTWNIGNLSFSNIYKTSDGDYIAYMATDNGKAIRRGVFSFNRVIRFSSSGQLRWSTQLYTWGFDAGGLGTQFKRGIIQLTNKNIVIGDAVYRTENPSEVFQISDGRLHFSCLDYNTGKITWESNYPYIIPGIDPFFVPDIYNVKELDDGRLSFTTSLYLNTALQPKLTNKAVTIITDNKGLAQKLVSYYDTSGNAYKLVDVTQVNNAGNKNMLLQRGNLSVVSSVNKEGIVGGSAAYAGVLPANCFTTGPRGHAIFMSDNYSLQFGLLITDAAGNADCVETKAELLSETIPTVNDDPKIVVTTAMVNNENNYTDYFVDRAYPLIKEEEYPLIRTISCEKAIECCKDIVDPFPQQVKLCEGMSFILPDSSIVKDSGTYYVRHKTALGCDSIIYYNVKIDKGLSSLTLGPDTCFASQPHIILKATEGFASYSWMGTSNSSSSSSYTAQAPGLYWVNVTNVCGSKSDSIQVYDHCDFPVYMPDAFTPNGDNLNDDFGVPKENINRLVELKIYDRWGQIVFETNNIYKRWDGKFKNQLLGSNVYVYYLVMKGLSGNKITQKGRVLLIR